MNKDVIYIDTEDDITAIIGKIKDSKQKIIAIVPPKRTGILQSAVNIKLLARIAENDNKRLVLVTNNKALIALSSVAQIPIAKNLQSKPEMAEIDVLEIDDGEDIIDGAKLPIGELAKTADIKEDEEIIEAIDTINIEKDNSRFTPRDDKSNKKNKIKVPDFARFRKKLFIGIFASIALICFLVWAIGFDPAATIVITAKTTDADVSLPLKLGGAIATDVSKGIIQTVSKQVQKNVSVTFDATGTKKIGDKATGTLTLSNADSSEAIFVPSGAVFSSGDYDFITTAGVTVPGAGVSGGHIVSGTKTVTVNASEVGSEFNLAPGAYQSSVDGITAYGSQMAGGSSRTAVVVTASDIQKASQALADLSNDSIKKQLTSQFANGEYVISDSFNVSHADPISTPALDAEATSKVTLSSQTTFTMTAVAKSELIAFLKNAINKQVDSKTQRIYSDGIDKVKLSGYVASDQMSTINVSTTGQIGPNINEDSIKQQAKGLQYGDVQALITKIKGVDNVDTKFSYFWVTTVPNDVKKIDIQFTVKNA